MSQPISFLSDFGRTDEFVGVVHGVIARIAPEVRVLDIGHDFPRGDVRAAALGLLRAVQYMPQGVLLDEMGQSTIHDWPAKSRSPQEVTARLCA